MSSSDDGVSPIKRIRREEAKERAKEKEEENRLLSSSKKQHKTKERSPERRKKRKRTEPTPDNEPEFRVDARYQESEDEAEDEARTENGQDDEEEEGNEPTLGLEDGMEDENARDRMQNGGEDDCFGIPSRDDDLLFHGKAGYKIDDVMDTDDAITCVEYFEDEIQQERWRCLYERFPAFFALVRSPSDGSRPDVPASLRSRLVNSLILTYSHMNPYLKKVLLKAADPKTAQNKKVRARCRDMSDHVLMLIYLLYKLVVIFEDEARMNKRKPARKTGGRGRPKKAKIMQNDDADMLSGGDDEMEGAGAEDEGWEDNKQKLLDTLTDIVNITIITNEGKVCESALRQLWQGSFDKQMLSTLLMCAVKFLENPDITKARSRPVLTSVFKLIRALCINFRQFNYIGGYLFETLLSLDYYKEGAATSYPFIERIKSVAVNKDTSKLLEGMIEYFKRATISVSNNNSKALCLFMSAIVEAEPYIVFFGVAPFLGLLTDENASVRSTVLHVITTLLTQDFLDPQKAPLSERFCNARNTMFDRLLQHVRDINANVRASALKCLTQMAKAQKIPTDMIQDGLVQLVGQRIGDDKIAVRKEAIRFATTFLENNPYGHDFDRCTNEKALKEIILKRDRTRTQCADSQAVNEAQKVFDSFKEPLMDEVLKFTEEYMLDMFEVPTEEERRDIYRAFQERQDQVMHGGVGPPTIDEDITMRWLFTMILSEENEVRIPARLLVAMAITDQLRGEHLTLEILINECQTVELMAERMMEAGKFLFVNTASMIIGRDEETALQKEQDTERWRAKDIKYSKDIDDMVMKLVLEQEFAVCLPQVMSSVMAGEAGDLKLGIEFVVKCKEFNISGSEAAVRQLCALVWKSDEEGRQQILQAASSMFLSSNASTRLRDAATCENILNLVKSMSDHERGSVEQVLALTTKFNPIPLGVYTLLWEQVDEDSIGKATSAEKKRKQVAAMKALCLLSRSDVDRNRQWLRRYQSIIKGGWPEIAAEALGCIANLATRHTKEDKPGVDAKPYRIAGKDSLFPTIQQFMLAEMCREEARTWNRSLRATLDIYFHICRDTSAVVATLVAKMLWLLRRTSQALRYYDQQTGPEELRTPSRIKNEEPNIDPVQREMVAEERSKYLTRLWSVLVERLCVLAGEVAIRLLVHADYVFVREFIQARERISKLEKPATFPKRRLHDWEVNSVLRRGIWDWGTGNTEDEECTGLSEDERIRELAREMIDRRLIQSYTILGRLLPIVVHAVRAKGSPPRVRFQGMNALAKFMLVSPHIAQCGARTFFAFLNNAPSPILRSNLTVIAADLTFRHPNLVENHAAALFAQLQDSDSCVREACVLILNHLISNDLIKTHVILSYALLGYIDPVPSIQHLTRGLFHEWSKKEGIMNHVPSFITRIAADSRELPIENFRTIMNLFIPLIRERKDADVQGLVIKLCKRIEFAKTPACVVRNPDMPAYFSHCLQLLTLNVKGFHKLVDCLEQYSPHLGDVRVYDDISSLVRVFQKDDLKANGGHSDIGDEIALFLRKLAELHEQQKNEREVEGMVARMQMGKKDSQIARKMRGRRALAATTATPARKKGNRKGRFIDSSEDEAMDD